MTSRDPLSVARTYAFHYGADSRKGKPADSGHVWCAECGLRQVSEDIGDLCSLCANRLSRNPNAAYIWDEKRGEPEFTDEAAGDLALAILRGDI